MAKKKSQDNNSGPKVARVYIRVSHQGERGRTPGGGEFLSPTLQLDGAKDYAKVRLKDFTLDEQASEAHADIDISASRVRWQKRQGLVAHLEAAQRGEFSALIVFKLSRLARNAREGLELFDLFENAGCSIHCIKENIDTTTATGRMVRTILLAVAEMESENISEFVKAAARARAEKGLPHGAVPFWISKDGDGYVPNERKSDIRALVDLRLQGMGQALISQNLNALGVKPPSKGRWTSTKVSKYLTEHSIALMQGHYTFGADKEEGDPDRIVIENLFPQIISAEEAEALLSQARRLREMYGDGGPRKASATTFILSGLFRCATCGGPMRSRTSYPENKPPRAGYECRRIDDDVVPHPSGGSITAGMAEDAVMRAVLAAASDYREQFASAPPVKAMGDENGTAVEKQIHKLTQRISKLMDDYEDGLFLKEDFEPRYKTLVENRERLRETLKQADSTATMQFVMNEALQAAAEPKLTSEQARRLVMAFVQRVEGLVAVDPRAAGMPNAKQARGLWVTLRVPLDDGTTRVLAPVYTAAFKGERLLLGRE